MIDENDVPLMLSYKKVLLPVLIVGGVLFLVNAVFIVPLIFTNFQEHDNDAAFSLIAEFSGTIIIFAGVILSKINYVKNKRLEMDLPMEDPVDKLDAL